MSAIPANSVSGNAMVTSKADFVEMPGSGKP
jgi:hypothetical protein